MTLHVFDYIGPDEEPRCVREEIIGQPNITGSPTTIATGEATTTDGLGDCTYCGEPFLWGGARTIPTAPNGCKCCDECEHIARPSNAKRKRP